jgi:DNA-binding NarL/FixJ family response regulator
VAAVEEPTFLVVDDEPLILRQLSRMLGAFGRVWAAATVGDARALLEERQEWSGFVIDLRLPDGSGLDVLDLVRREHPFAPAILLSGAIDPEGVNGAYARGARPLCKPWPAEALRHFAREALITQQDIPRRITEAVSDLANKHSLTPTETEILFAAVRGIDRAAIVASRRVSENTHKTQVRGILRKTRTLSLGELRDRVLRSVAGAGAA